MGTEVTHLNKQKRLYKKNSKAARLVVRNLPFSCREEDVLKYFTKFGDVSEMKLLKKDGRNIGCGFVQFDNKNVASKAMRLTSGQPFMSRPIIVDWAITKNKFQNIQIKEVESGNNKKLDVVKYKLSESPKKINEISNSDTGSESSDSVHSEPSVLPVKRLPYKKIKTEGETIFFKEIPFQVTSDELKECAEKVIGPVEYAVICMDPLTEHSKGTGFIRFKDKIIAEKLLNNEKKLILYAKELVAFKFLEKEELEKLKLKKKAHKDNRNLYLTKEGVILPGSPAAKAVSATDMSKRLFLEQQKSRNLRNLHKFVSPTRLVIYNLPIKNFDNNRLLNLFKTSGPKGAFIKEARIMRNLKDLDERGIARSRGYGYVTFTKHEDALSALRTINNNPNIFTDKKRPIVSFSVENRVAINIIEKRKQMNKNQAYKKQKIDKKSEEIAVNKIQKRKQLQMEKRRSKKKLKKAN